MSLTLINNQINSKYIIINIKLDFSNNETIKYKYNYYKIIINWLKLSLDKYLLIYNWIFYIQNLNYDTIRIFLFTTHDNYPNMDNYNLIYLTNNFKHTTDNININNLEKLFDISELKIIINQEFELIKKTLSSASSNENDAELKIINDSNNIINDYYNDYAIINKKSNIYDIKINAIEQKINIVKIGMSGTNKLTFISELKKINTLQVSKIYYNDKHNIYNNNIFQKIKENNKFYWVEYNNLESKDQNNLEYIFSIL